MPIRSNPSENTEVSQGANVNQSWYAKIYRYTLNAITQCLHSSEATETPKPEAIEVVAKTKKPKTPETIASIPLEERSFEDHLVWCIHKAKSELFTNNISASDAIRRMYLNLIKHPEYADKKIYEAIYSDFMLNILGKSPVQAKEMALEFLNGFWVMDDYKE